MEFSLLRLSEPGESTVHLVTQTATAEFFGWRDSFPEWKAVGILHPSGYRSISWNEVMVERGKRRGGKRLRICRVKRKTGYPAKFTHCFRIRGAFNNRHLARMAKAAGDRFEWMESKWGQRVNRDVWLSLPAGSDDIPQ